MNAAEHEGEQAARVAALKEEAAELGLTVVEPKPRTRAR